MINRWTTLGAAVVLSLALQGCADEPPPPSGSEPSAWIVTPSSVAGIRFGMSVAQAGAVLDGGLGAPESLSGCDYAAPPSGPEGLGFMISNGIVARVDVDEGTTPTAEGARVGMAQAELLALYGSRAEVQPHKYIDGSYVIVRENAAVTGGSFALVFETDGSRVLRYRAGRTPEVEWVERCG